MRLILFSLFFFISIASQAQFNLSDVRYSQKDSLDVMMLINKGKNMANDNNRFLKIARLFIGRPYIAYTLDREKEEKLVVNSLEVDCTTYVEYVLAIEECLKHKQYTFKDFCYYLSHIRYIGGQVDYTKRQHYFSIWIEDNIKDGFIREISSTRLPFTAIQTINVNYMTSHVASYYMLNNNRTWIKGIKELENSINGKKYRYIPKSRIKNTQILRETIKNGDILAIVTSKKGLDISHLGLAVWKKDGLHLLNASSIHKKVIEEPMTLSQYLQKHPTFIGIRVIRVK